jgi:hypothetical protein
MEVRGQFHAPPPSLFTHGERAPNTRWIGGLVDSRAGVEAMVKRKLPSPCQESNPARPARGDRNEIVGCI